MVSYGRLKTQPLSISTGEAHMTAEEIAAFREEIRAGYEDRAAGMEGRARVRARRAAGHVIGIYLREAGLPDPGPNALDRLRYLRTLPGLPPEVYPLLEHLTMKVDINYRLPPGVDLLADAQRLAELLLGEDAGNETV